MNDKNLKLEEQILLKINASSSSAHQFKSLGDVSASEKNLAMFSLSFNVIYNLRLQQEEFDYLLKIPT